MDRLKDKIVMITGASAGIGKSSALAFAAEGTHLALGARRTDRLETVAADIRERFGARVFTHELDVRDAASVRAFAAASMAEFGRIDVLLNNAGLAVGRSTVLEVTDEERDTMFDTNVNGVLRVTQAVVPHMLAGGGGHVVNLGSLAGHLAYAGGSIYCATKHALKAITETLRLELLGKPIRISSIDPGLVETEFSVVRFGGDVERAEKVYEGMTPLNGDDIAEIIVFVASRPLHVNIDKVLVNPVDQAVLNVARRETKN